MDLPKPGYKLLAQELKANPNYKAKHQDYQLQGRFQYNEPHKLFWI